MELKDSKIHIIGGTGQMGSWLKKFLESQGLIASVSDKNNHVDNLIKSADIIFISVPIDVAPGVILESAKKVKKSCLLVDLSSIKKDTVEALKMTTLASLGVHFLFGPTVSSIHSQKIASISVKENNLSKQLIKMFEKAGAQILKMSVLEHDKKMAYIQALTHFVNLSFAKILFDEKIDMEGKISTPVFLAQLGATNRVVSQDPKLISSIQLNNPHFLSVLKKLLDEQTLLLDLLNKKDAVGLENLYGEISSKVNLKRPDNLKKEQIQKSAGIKINQKMRVAYLGPKGTFSHQATTQIISKKQELLESKTIYDIFLNVAQGVADYGLVPAENSTEGTIRETLDLLIDFDLKVNLEIELPVHQNILSREKNINKITKVISHPQAIAQSRLWLEQNLPNMQIENSASTIAAISDLKNGGVAIIGSELAAKIYNLNILARNIEAKENNITKFYLVSKNLQSFKKKPGKTLLYLTVFNRVGVLKDILSVLADFDINLNKLESRPSREKNWDYYFYVEVESSLGNSRLKQALNILKHFCPVIKILGEY